MMKTTNFGMTWWELSDIKVGQILPKESPYPGAKIVKIFKNGWCRCKQPNNTEFSARVHWLTPKNIINSSL